MYSSLCLMMALQEMLITENTGWFVSHMQEKMEWGDRGNRGERERGRGKERAPVLLPRGLWCNGEGKVSSQSPDQQVS